MSFTVKSNASSQDSHVPIPQLAYADRHSRLHFTNGDGTVGEIRYPINYEDIYNLKGRLLTVIDATFTDPQQRKAQKDVVWQTLQRWMHDIQRGAGEDPMGETAYSEDSPEP